MCGICALNVWGVSGGHGVYAVCGVRWLCYVYCVYEEGMICMYCVWVVRVRWV